VNRTRDTRRFHQPDHQEFRTMKKQPGVTTLDF